MAFGVQRRWNQIRNRTARRDRASTPDDGVDAEAGLAEPITSREDRDRNIEAQAVALPCPDASNDPGERYSGEFDPAAIASNWVSVGLSHPAPWTALA